MSSPNTETNPAKSPRGAVLAKAVLAAAARLGLSKADLASVLGVSPPSITRMARGEFALDEDRKEFELAALLVRVFRSLDALAGGDAAVVRGWMAGDNSALGGRPVELIRKVSGLTQVLYYLDGRRALV